MNDVAFPFWPPATDTTEIPRVPPADRTPDQHPGDERPPVTGAGRRVWRAAVNVSAAIGALYTTHVALALTASAIWL